MIDLPLIDSDEELIWQGKPYPARYALRKTAYIFSLGIFFFAFSLFWIYGAYNASSHASGQFQFFWIFGIPFVIVGAGLVLTPAWYFFRATATTYALTDRRAIIDISGPFARRTASRSIRYHLSTCGIPRKVRGTFSSKKPPRIPRITASAEAQCSEMDLSLLRTRRKSDRC